ncbi:DUF6884 domain-containing protein [Streptomyces cucumeris]|uniref:DUF6884 domain-containing protein n=1 Tax=Streptomyces cucumeris TaxID=2962890 RepID=UPI003D75B168
MGLRDEGRTIRRSDGTEARRPLWDTGWGEELATRYARRRRAYVTASTLQLDRAGRAEMRLDFPRAADGKGAARCAAARAIAAAYGLRVRPLRREPLALTVRGDAEDVARVADALPRVLHHAEQLTSWVARMYGEWSRSPRHTHHFDALDDRERRTLVRDYRAAAFRVIVGILTGPQPAAAPPVDPSLPPWEQTEAIAARIGEYGWVEIRDAYDPAAALQLLHTAERIEAPAARWPVAAAHGEQLALFDGTSPAPQPEAGPVVVIPCSGPKLDHAAPAGELYTGSLHTHARRTADALTAHGGTVLVLSALHGFLPLDQVVQPYDHTWKDTGSVTVEELRAQATELGLTDADVVLLTPGQYTQRAAAVWPQAHTPLDHLGIGQQRGRLTAMRESADQYTTAA